MTSGLQSAVARVFAIPVILAMIIAAGLISGVLSDGIWDVLCWIALSIPLGLIAWNALKPAPPGKPYGDSSSMAL